MQKKLCRKLQSEGYNVKPSTYSMYDGKKGIYLQVLDAEGDIFCQYASGIHATLSGMIDALTRSANRIRKQC